MITENLKQVHDNIDAACKELSVLLFGIDSIN